MSVTGAEFKLTLQALGLPPSWFADQMDVTMRTVVRWFDGDVIPPRTAVELERLYNETLNAMRDVIRNIQDVGGLIVLSTYRTDDEFVQFYEFGKTPLPASWHRALTFRVMEHLRANGHQVSVVYAS